MKKIFHKIRFLLLLTLIFQTLIFCFSMPKCIKADDSIKSDICYNNKSDIPNEIIKGGRTYKLSQITPLNGSYSTNTTVQDYCVYAGYGYMNFAYQFGQVPSSRMVTVEGYSFSINMTSYYQVHQTITEYASPGYFLRGQSSYYDDGHYVSISETQWHGDDGLVVGATYHTADHLNHVEYSGTAYYGVYEEVQSNPNISWNSITGQQYVNGDTYWYKLGNNDTVPTFQVAWNDLSTDIMNSYLILTYNGTNVLRAGADHHNNNTNGWNDVINKDYINNSSNVCEVDAGRNAQFRFQPTVVKSGLYHVYTGACNVAVRWQNPSQTEGIPIDTGKTIGMDEQAPIYDKIIIDDGKINECNFTITGVKDYCDTTNTISGSGIKEVKVALFPITDDGYRGSDIWTTGIYDEATQQVYINGKFASHYDGTYGQYNAHIYMTDNVGNLQIITKTILRAKPNPEDMSIDLTGWDYKEPNSNKCWIKVGHSATVTAISRNSQEYSELSNGYPTQLLYQFDKYNNSSQLETQNDVNGYSSVLDSNFYYKSNGLNVTNLNTATYELNGYKYLKSVLKVTGQASANSKGYLISGTSYTLLDGVKYYYSDSNNNTKWALEKDGEYLYLDGEAPTIESANATNGYDEITVNINNINDNGLSGSKEADIIVKRNGSQVSKKTIAARDNDNISQKFTKSELGNVYGKYTVDIVTRDNVGNEKLVASNIPVEMLNPKNLTAKRIDIYDPRENRYVSQIVSGLDYIAVVEYTNTGACDLNTNYSIGLKIAGDKYATVNGDPIKVGESKEAKFKFTAGGENLNGNQYEGDIDVNNEIEESNENDNVCKTVQPYVDPVSDNKPPIIPVPNTDGKPSNPVPIITVKLDLVADYINVVKTDSEEEIPELICAEKYRIKFKLKNESSLNIKYLDIKNKVFNNNIFYDNSLLDSFDISDIGAGETKTFYKELDTPSLNEGEIEAIKEIKGIVDNGNMIHEINENNNTILNRKTTIGLKVIDYRIVSMVNPIKSYNYPILYTDMPVGVKSGYNVIFRCNIKGRADDVYAKITDTNGTNYDIQHMNKVQDISPTESIYEYTLTVPLDLPQNTIISTEIIATQGSAAYNFNTKNSWDGKTLTIGGNAKEDIVIYRKY